MTQPIDDSWRDIASLDRLAAQRRRAIEAGDADAVASADEAIAVRGELAAAAADSVGARSRQTPPPRPGEESRIETAIQRLHAKLSYAQAGVARAQTALLAGPDQQATEALANAAGECRDLQRQIGAGEARLADIGRQRELRLKAVAAAKAEAKKAAERQRQAELDLRIATLQREARQHADQAVARIVQLQGLGVPESKILHGLATLPTAENQAQRWGLMIHVPWTWQDRAAALALLQPPTAAPAPAPKPKGAAKHRLAPKAAGTAQPAKKGARK